MIGIDKFREILLFEIVFSMYLNIQCLPSKFAGILTF